MCGQDAKNGLELENCDRPAADVTVTALQANINRAGAKIGHKKGQL